MQIEPKQAISFFFFTAFGSVLVFVYSLLTNNAILKFENTMLLPVNIILNNETFTCTTKVCEYKQKTGEINVKIINSDYHSFETRLTPKRGDVITISFVLEKIRKLNKIKPTEAKNIPEQLKKNEFHWYDSRNNTFFYLQNNLKHQGLYDLNKKQLISSFLRPLIDPKMSFPRDNKDIIYVLDNRKDEKDIIKINTVNKTKEIVKSAITNHEVILPQTNNGPHIEVISTNEYTNLKLSNNSHNINGKVESYLAANNSIYFVSFSPLNINKGTGLKALAENFIQTDKANKESYFRVYKLNIDKFNLKEIYQNKTMIDSMLIDNIKFENGIQFKYDSNNYQLVL
jgi:hypothetical protein